MKIPEFKRSGIRIITEFHRIPSGYPNQENQAMILPKEMLTGTAKVGNI
jgi:hypothetical protein